MRICVFSDIHGNGAAFSAALKMMCSEKADVNLFLGDICGYYYDQVAVFEELMTMPNLMAVKGNHDDLFLRMRAGDENLRRHYREKYGSSMDSLLEQETKSLCDWIESLPESYTDERMGIMCMHGSPFDTLNGYVYPDSPVDAFMGYDRTLFIMGHTHYPMQRSIKDKLILNPGSLGQARSGGWPTYAVVDTDRAAMQLKHVAYDKAPLLRQIEKHGDGGRYLETILYR